MVASPRWRLDPNAWRSAPDLEPSEGEQDESYDERTDCVLASDVSGARLEPREKRGKATHWNQPVRGGDGKEQDAEKCGDQRQGSVHRANVRESLKFSVTLLIDAPRAKDRPGDRRLRKPRPAARSHGRGPTALVAPAALERLTRKASDPVGRFERGVRPRSFAYQLLEAFSS